MIRYHSLYLDFSDDMGRGVFTDSNIPGNTIVETAPVIVMTATERLLLDQTLLHDYIFEWGEDRSQCAMALGWVPLFNHASPSNCEYFMDFEADIIFIKTVREIIAGEQLYVNYKGDFDDDDKVWFELKKS
jgi:SET domain-containing protein